MVQTVRVDTKHSSSLHFCATVPLQHRQGSRPKRRRQSHPDTWKGLIQKEKKQHNLAPLVFLSHRGRLGGLF